MNISLLIGLKNNLDYNKHFYQTTRELYPNIEIVFVSYGSTDGTHEWLDSLSYDSDTITFHSDENKTFSDTFNKATELATKEYIVYLHNDIVLAPGFLENINKHINSETVVSYTTIEPPIFAGHERPGKIINDFGTDLITFNKQQMFDFVRMKQIFYKNQTEEGVTFFMCLNRKKLIEIGGLDNLYNPMFCEDDDLIHRLDLLDLKLITSLDAICYHFVSKTSRFSEEYQTRTQQIEANSNRNFIRKWGERNTLVKYDIGLVVDNCGLPLLNALEPYCSNIYLDDTMNLIIPTYIQHEQPNTKFNLKTRIKQNYETKTNNIIIKFDGNLLNNDNFQYIQHFPLIIHNSGDVGEFKIDIFNVTIKDMQQYEKDLIYNNSLYYLEKLL